MNNIVHKPRKYLMAADLQTLLDYFSRRDLPEAEYQTATDTKGVLRIPKGSEITLVLTECDWQAERALKDMAISLDMVITETYG